eukprot:1157418-Pelagomonas_calceolata.AAC.15
MALLHIAGTPLPRKGVKYPFAGAHQAPVPKHVGLVGARQDIPGQIKPESFFDSHGQLESVITLMGRLGICHRFPETNLSPTFFPGVSSVRRTMKALLCKEASMVNVRPVFSQMFLQAGHHQMCKAGAGTLHMQGGKTGAKRTL